MIKTQNWRLDTCGCVLEQEYDTVDYNATNKLKSIIKKCSDHSLVPDNSIYTVAIADLKRKNIVRKFLVQNFTDLAGLKATSDGTQSLDFKDGIQFVWSFTGADQARILNVQIIGFNLKVAQKTQINTFCNATFGINKVVLA